MEQILTSKKIVERNLSIVKHINDKYVLYKDENKITRDDGEPKVSSVYGVTTIDKLRSVKGYCDIPYLIVIPDDPSKEPYFVTSIPTDDLEKLKNGIIHFENYDFRVMLKLMMLIRSMSLSAPLISPCVIWTRTSSLFLSV